MRTTEWVKVYVDYSDGQTWLELYTEGHAKVNLAGVEIPLEEWTAYQTYCITSRLWNTRLRELDNQQYENHLKQQEPAA